MVCDSSFPAGPIEILPLQHLLFLPGSSGPFIPREPLSDGKYEYTSVKIRAHVMPVELHQAAVSQVIRFVDSSWDGHGKGQTVRGSCR